MSALNQKFGITLNPNTFQFRLQKLKSPEDKHLCIKKLTTKQMLRFGTEVNVAVNPPHDSTPVMCGLCFRYLDGPCFKHPLIFVKEHIPPLTPHTFNDTFPSFLELKQSTIPKAGRGVFTKLDLPAGVCFGPYAGFVYLDPKLGGYAYTYEVYFMNERRFWINAEEKNYTNWLRFVNCARFEQEQNLISMEYMQNIFFFTYKPVCAGSELFVWYGTKYGMSLQIPGAEHTTNLKAPRKKVCRKMTAPKS